MNAQTLLSRAVAVAVILVLSVIYGIVADVVTEARENYRARITEESTSPLLSPEPGSARVPPWSQMPNGKP